MPSPELNELIEKRFGQFVILNNVSYNGHLWFQHKHMANSSSWFLAYSNTTQRYILFNSSNNRYTEQELIRLLRLYVFA